MKFSLLFFALIVFAFSGYSQTVENIRVVQDGDNLKITYRIGASSDAQLYNVFLSCSMDGGKRFDPDAVIGDVGENIIGGKSFYTIIWDVFEDVEEVVNPEFFIKVDLVSDMSAAAAGAATTRAQQPANQEPVEQKQEETTQQATPFEPTFEEVESSTSKPEFERNGFFAYNGILGMTPIGISFGSLNNLGYYVTPLRLGWDTYDFYDNYYGTWETDFDFHYMASAGVTKHFVSAGPYRLHGYWGLGGHIIGQSLNYDPLAFSHFVLETGIINVVGGFQLTVGIAYSIGYVYATNLVLGLGFVF